MTATIGLDTVVCQRADALCSAIDDEIVLMSIERGKYYGLSKVGSDIWRRLTQPISAGNLCAALAGEYTGDRAVIEHDTIAMLEQLAERDLVESVAA